MAETNLTTDLADMTTQSNVSMNNKNQDHALLSSPTRPPLDPSASKMWEGNSSRHERKSTAGSVYSSTSLVSGFTVLGCTPFDPSNTTTLANGVIYEYFQGDFECMPDFNGILQQRKKIGVTHTILIDSFTELGLFSQTETSQDQQEGNYAVRFTGQIKIPQEGIWTFSTTSNDGSVLYIGGKKVVDNDGQHYATEKYGKIKLKAGYYPFMLGYFHKTGKLMEGLRTGPCLSLQFYCVSQSWLSQGGEYSKKQAIPASLLHYNYMNPILMPAARAVSADETLVYETPYSKITQLQEQMMEMSTDYEDKIAELEAQLEQQKMQTWSMMQYIATAASSATSTPSSSRLSSLQTTPQSSNDTLDEIPPDTSLLKDLSLRISPEEDQMHLLDQVISDIDKLKASAFFSMGLAYKLTSHSNLNLHELWDKVTLENIPMESWHTVFC